MVRPMLETVLTGAFEPGSNLKGDVAGGVWTLLLPTPELGHVVCLGLPGPAALRTVARLAETVAVHRIVDRRSTAHRGAPAATARLPANVELHDWDGGATIQANGRKLSFLWLSRDAAGPALSGGALTDLVATITPVGAIYAEGGLVAGPGHRGWRPPPLPHGNWSLLRVGALLGEVRSAVPLDDRLALRFVERRRLEGRWLEGSLARRGVPYAARLARVLTAGGVAGRAVHRVAALALVDGDPRRPPRYVRQTASEAGHDLSGHRWALSAAGEYATQKALLYLFPAGGALPDLLVKTTLDPGTAGRLENGRRRLVDLGARMPVTERRFPEIVFAGRPGGRQIVAERFLDGVPFVARSTGTPDCRFAADAVGWLTRISVTTARPMAAANHATALGGLLDRFAALYRPPDPLIGGLHGQVERLTAIRSPIPAVFQHGDPGVQNLLVGPAGRVSFIDWENAEDPGAPLWDLLIFLRAYAVWSSRRRGLKSRLGAAVEHFVDGSSLSPFILDAMAQYRRAVDVPSEAVEPFFFMAWVYQAVKEAPRLQRDRLADGQFVQFLDTLLQRRDAPLLRRLLGAVEA